MNSKNRFIIRVYGILINLHNELLISNEQIKDFKITKLPGGGLKFGESTKDCLKREFLEETGLEIKVNEHIYTTEDCIISKFSATKQVLAIYYRVSLINLNQLKNFKTFEIKHHEYKSEINSIYHSWTPIEQLNSTQFTFVSEQKAIETFIGKGCIQ